MQGIDRGEFKIIRIRRTTGFLAACFVLLLLAPGAHADMACTDCHGSPNGPHGSQCGDCSSCHGYPPVTSMPGGPTGLVGPIAGQTQPLPTGSTSAGAHAKHAIAPPTGLGYACVVCHYNGMPATPLLGNNKIQIGFNIPLYGGSYSVGGTYDGAALSAPYTYEGTNSTSVTTGGAKTCSSIYCHSDGTSVSSGATPNGMSPAWDSPSLFACTGCHGFPPSYTNGQPKANSHSHTQSCHFCHYGTTTDGTTITNPALHANGVYNIQPDPSATFNGVPVSFTYTYDQNGGTCSAISCHGGGTLSWGAVLTPADCAVCHTSSPHALSIPMGSTTCQGCHTEHGFIPVAATCNVCHSSPPIAPFTTTQVNALAPYMHGAYSTIPDATCVSCHGTKTLKYAMPGVNCTQCHTSHGFLPITPPGTPNPTCRTCHPVGSYDTYAVNMHMDKPTAGFGLSKNGLTVNADGSVSTCPTGDTCAYSWDFGDSATGSGQTTSHTYGSAGTYTITLTVTDTTHNTSATASQSVTVTQPNRPPVAAFATGYPSVSGWTVTVKDASTDPDGNLTGSSAITVTWGDGPSTRCAPGGTVNHTYTVANTYTITLTATDTAGLSSSVSSGPIVISMGTVTGTVKNALGNPVNLAKVTITVPGATKTAYTNSSGVYTISNVQPGTGRAMTATSGATTFATQAWVTSGVVGTVNSGTNIVNFTP